jgi:hypothetical protein
VAVAKSATSVNSEWWVSLKMIADQNPILPGITLEQFCRALAAHLLLASHPDLLHSVMAPETAEQTAQAILRFASGEDLERPAAPEAV